MYIINSNMSFSYPKQQFQVLNTAEREIQLNNITRNNVKEEENICEESSTCNVKPLKEKRETLKKERQKVQEPQHKKKVQSKSSTLLKHKFSSVKPKPFHQQTGQLISKKKPDAISHEIMNTAESSANKQDTCETEDLIDAVTISKKPSKKVKKKETRQTKPQSQS